MSWHDPEQKKMKYSSQHNQLYIVNQTDHIFLTCTIIHLFHFPTCTLVFEYLSLSSHSFLFLSHIYINKFFILSIYSLTLLDYCYEYLDPFYIISNPFLHFIVHPYPTIKITTFQKFLHYSLFNFQLNVIFLVSTIVKIYFDIYNLNQIKLTLITRFCSKRWAYSKRHHAYCKLRLWVRIGDNTIYSLVVWQELRGPSIMLSLGLWIRESNPTSCHQRVV